MWQERIYDLIRLLKPKYYNILTRIVVLFGLSLVSKPIWIDIVNIFFAEFQLSLIGAYDQIAGIGLVVIALIFNTYNRYLELIDKSESQPAYKEVKHNESRSFGDLCQMLYPIIIDNEYIFKTVGPNSSSNSDGELRMDLTVWNLMKERAILPNNDAIKKLISENKQRIPDKHKSIFSDLLIHIEAFNEHLKNPDFDYSKFQFPVGVKQIIMDEAFNKAKGNSDLRKVLKWLRKKMSPKVVQQWFVFGSYLFAPERANDIDIVVKLNESSSRKNIDRSNKLGDIKTEFKLCFGRELHVTTFNKNEDNAYSIFLSKNPYKTN